MSELAADDEIIEGRYRVLNFIGGGAMARVYKVERLETGTVHALKAQRIAAPDESLGNALEAAENEVRLLSNLSHPSLPRVTDWFHDPGHVYIVMDYVEGRNLKTLLEGHHNAGFDVTTVIQWGLQICEVLEYLHGQFPPVVFRDIKPSNLIRRPDDRICLVDFGIARQAKKGSATDTSIFGSPGYAPPEQYGQGQTDARSDIYALGATLHQLVTGRDPSLTPFRLPPARSVNPLVPILLERLLIKCLEMEPNRRPQSAREVGSALKNIQELFKKAEIRPSPVAMPTTPLIQTDATTQDLLSVARREQARAGASTQPASLVYAMALQPERAAAPAALPARTVDRTLAYLYPVFQVGALVAAMLGLLTLLPPVGGALAPAGGRALEVYGSLAGARGAVALASALALGFGALRPRLTRLGLAFSAYGLLGMLLLAALLWLPGRWLGFTLSGLALTPLLALVAAFWPSARE